MEEEQLERLIRKRGAMRGATTKLLQSFNTELNEDNVDVGRLRELLANLSVKEETLLDLDRVIEQGIATADLVAEITNTEEYKERVITMRSRAQRVIQASDSVSSPRRFAGERTPTQNSVKLPNLTGGSVEPYHIMTSVSPISWLKHMCVLMGGAIATGG